MSNLISTQESVAKIVDTAIQKILSGEQKLTKEYEQSVKDAVNLILNTARRTEQPIIRCKDCKYHHPNYCAAWIRFDTIKTKPDDYCSRAERREDGSD